jgi:hypothetical protein
VRPPELLDDPVVRDGLADHEVEGLTAAAPSSGEGRRSAGRSGWSPK